MKRLRVHSLLREPGGLQRNYRMTPMIDVVFLLLIFFVLTANFRPSEGYLPADLPRQAAGGAALTELEPLTVWLRPGSDGGCEVRLSGQAAVTIGPEDDFESLAGAVRGVLERQGRRLDDPVRLAPDTQTRWDHVVRAYDTLWRMGLTQIVFVMAD